MKKIEIVSKITLSIALISALGLSGCGGSNSKAIADNSGSKSNTLEVNNVALFSPKTEEKIETPSIAKQDYNVIVGKVSLDDKVRSLSKNQANITAYNLNNSSTYKVTTDLNGNYELSGLSDGEYQIFAENDRYAKKASQRVSLSKSTRKVVNFSLQATGSIQGKIVGAGVVYIPGTDHISITDSEGHFVLNGVPVGNYLLMYEGYDNDQKGSLDVSVVAGEAVAVDKESGFRADSSSSFGYIDTSLEYGVLGLHYEGIKFHINGLYYNYSGSPEPSEKYSKNERYMNDFEYIKKYITLKNSAGNDIDFKIEDNAIKSNEIVPAGEYTLTFSKEISEILDQEIKDDRVYKFSVDNVSVAIANMDHGARVIDLVFPKLLSDAQKSAFGNLKVVEKGVAESLDIKQVWSDNRALSLFGSFKTGVEYEIIPTNDSQKDIIGNMKILNNILEFGHVEVNDIYPKDGTDHVGVDQNLFVSVQYSDQIDPATVEFNLDNHVYKGKDIIFDKENSYHESSSLANISFKHEKLAYDKEYTLIFTAKDISGNSITKRTTFKTMKPSIVEMSPQGMDELFDDRQNISFNVPVNKESGSIVIENLTNSSDMAQIDIDNRISKYDNSEIYFSISSIKPNQRYKITASGFKDLDGIEIPAKVIEFSTPPKMMFIPKEYSQNMSVSAKNFNHKVNLLFFGGLSDAEKTFLENNLVVTSYNQSITVDASHPQRKLFFTPIDNGVMVSVAFTIDPDTNYELSLSSIDGMSDIILPDNKKLFSFATFRTDGDIGNSDNKIKMINRLTVHQPHVDENNPTNTGMKLVSDIEMDINIPLGYAKKHEGEEGYVYYDDCWSSYRDRVNQVGDSLLDGSLHITSENQEIDFNMLDKNSYSWGINQKDFNGERLCYIWGYRYVASFDVDYNKDYQISLDFSNKISSEFPLSSKVLTKNLHTDPIGTLNFEVLDSQEDFPDSYDGMEKLNEMNSDMIEFNIHANAPIVTQNIKDLLQVKVNGANFTPEFNFERDNLQTTNDISFTLPRTLYSILQVEILKNPDQNMTFINPFTNEEVVNNSAFEKPIIFTEDVKPDLVPVEISEISTTSIENNQINLRFNRLVDMSDIATIADDGTISDIAFEVKDSDGNSVAISGVNRGFNGVVFDLSSDLNTSKVYRLSLKDGKSIKAAFGAQKLNQFSQEIPLSYLKVGEIRYLKQDATIRNDFNTPYVLGSTDLVDANYSSPVAKIIAPLMMKDNVSLDLGKSSLKVYSPWNKDDLLNKRGLIYNADRNTLVQLIRDNYSEANVEASIIYNVGSKEYKENLNIDKIYYISSAYINSYYGDSVDSIVFNINNMVDNYQITPENFKVYDESGEPFDANIVVAFNEQSNTSSPRVTFNNLESGKVYRVDIVDIPSYNAPSNMTILNDTLFIKN